MAKTKKGLIDSINMVHNQKIQSSQMNLRQQSEVDDTVINQTFEAGSDDSYGKSQKFNTNVPANIMNIVSTR